MIVFYWWTGVGVGEGSIYWKEGGKTSDVCFLVTCPVQALWSGSFEQQQTVDPGQVTRKMWHDGEKKPGKVSHGQWCHTVGANYNRDTNAKVTQIQIQKWHNYKYKSDTITNTKVTQLQTQKWNTEVSHGQCHTVRATYNTDTKVTQIQKWHKYISETNTKVTQIDKWN